MAGRRVRSGGAYHHGDLRAAVIAAGLKRLAKRNGVTIGLRALSRDVGVSATALYRYFPDKEALLDALADEGLRRLGAQQAQAWVKAGGGRASFLAAGIAYIRFAHDDPELFRLSFTRGKGLRSREQGGDGAEVAYNLLRAGIAQSLPHFEDQADSAALHAWALVHGAAMLILDRRIGWDEALIADVVGLTFGGAD
ncbi:TetR/AcrR family transcriptional regulator [Sphingopyxis chilensis]|uniref:TetR/AcrR family transcriptional regulator n=1 Tax=Sphingopyxis chilensis TaxID=180400 RepID=UPI002DDC9DD9|nr:TetR/AcrR family transcriptional regulator [Sphingopyxis chilensis]